MVATVLYTDEMEPITVFDMPIQYMDRSTINLPVWQAMKVTWVEEDAPLEIEPIKMVTIYRETFVRKGRRHSFWFVNERDLVNALKLRPDFLAGQRDEVDRRVRGALTRGFLMGLSE